MPHLLQMLDVKYMRTLPSQVKMGLDFLTFLHFAAYSLVLPLCSQIDTDGSTHLPIGKSFMQRESKWPRSIATMKKNTMSSEIAMDKLK